MLVKLVLGFLGVILFLFIFWKRLREDYSSDIIFQTATSVLVGLGLGLLAAKLFFPMWFFWLALLGGVAGMSLMLLKFRLKFYEALEAFILACLPLATLMFFQDSIVHSTLNSFLAFVVSLVFIFFAYWIDLNYKGFAWYKSGKIGFTGLFIAAFYFLTRAVIAIAGFSVVSFVGQYEVFFSGIITLIGVGLLINLGRVQE